jgi:hypothetical protein
MDEINNTDKVALIDQKIILYRRTHYDATLDAQIGKDLGDQQQVSRAKERMKAALKAVDILEKMRAELVKENKQKQS